MRKWVDVNEGDWFYNDVMEATNMVLEDGEVFVAGINYNKFKEENLLSTKRSKAHRDKPHLACRL